jgi:tol-pal system protein YbgF
MKLKVLLLGLSLAAPVLALPTVYNGAGVGSEMGVTQSGQATLDQQLQIIQQSLDNMKQMNFPEKIQQMQTQLQEQKGTIEVLQHKVEALQKQQSLQYQDLSKAIAEHAPTTADLPSVPMVKPVMAVPSASEKEVSPGEQDKRTYKSAYGLVTRHQYAQAIEAFKAYLQIYNETGQYSANANYWLGELYSQQKEYDKAKLALSTVLDKFPQSGKVPDALLKLGVIALDQGDKESAQKYFSEVKKKYPNTGSAQLAEQELQQI